MPDYLLALLSIVVTGAAAVVGARGVARARRRQRRARLLAAPPSAQFRDALARAVPVSAGLPDGLRRRFEDAVRVFLDEKQFIACGGLALSETMRLTIAGNACLIGLGREGVPFPAVRTILVYPTAFVAEHAWEEDHVTHELAEVRAGESWEDGPLIIAWDEVEADRAARDGGNVIVHEFAHKLDDENPDAEGLPLLPAGVRPAWARALGEAYAALVADVEAGRPALIDAYGAESPAEFFAVLAELFIEQPAALRDRHPALYEVLSQGLGIDPVTWVAARGRGRPSRSATPGR